MDSLTSILEEHVAVGDNTKDKLLGVAFVVVDKDEILFSGTAGRQGFDTDSPALQPDSWVWLASGTKLITTVALMQLVEKGVISLDDDLRDLIPQLAKLQILRGFDDEEQPILEDNDRKVTLRHLLTHTLGIGVDTADPDLQRWSKAVGRTATYMDYSLAGITTPLKFAPGEGFYYGTALDWAGQVLEKVTGERLGDYMQRNIFEPLGMSETGFWPEKLSGGQAKAFAWTYRQEDGVLKEGPVQTPTTHDIEGGGSGLFSTTTDYGKFLRGFLAGKLVKQETMDLMLTPQLNEAQASILMMIASAFHFMFVPEFPIDLELNHGIGGLINMADVPGKRKKGSMMWSGALNSRWWMDPKTGIAAILLANVTPHGDAVINQLYDRLERAVYDRLLPDRAAGTHGG